MENSIKFDFEHDFSRSVSTNFGVKIH